MKKKGLIIAVSVIAAMVLLVVGIGIAAIASGISYRENFIEKEENVKAAQSDISVQLQRRADLIPNFVETVKGYSDYEQETYTSVTEARSAVMSAETVSYTHLTLPTMAVV